MLAWFRVAIHKLLIIGCLECSTGAFARRESRMPNRAAAFAGTRPRAPGTFAMAVGNSRQQQRKVRYGRTHHGNLLESGSGCSGRGP